MMLQERCKMNLPNKITLARIFLIPVFMVVLMCGEYAGWAYAPYAGAFVFALASLTDGIDGHIARSRGLVTDFGKFLDPLADKVVIVVMLFLIVLFRDGLSMGGVYPHNALVIALLSGIILSRELMIGVFRSIAASRGLVLAADIYGKIKTVCLDIGVTVLMLAGLHPALGWIGTIVFYIGSFFAVYSGLNYVLKNKHVLKQDDEDEKKSESEEANQAK